MLRILSEANGFGLHKQIRFAQLLDKLAMRQALAYDGMVATILGVSIVETLDMFFQFHIKIPPAGYIVSNGREDGECAEAFSLIYFALFLLPVNAVLASPHTLAASNAIHRASALLSPVFGKAGAAIMVKLVDAVPLFWETIISIFLPKHILQKTAPDNGLIRFDNSGKMVCDKDERKAVEKAADIINVAVSDAEKEEGPVGPGISTKYAKRVFAVLLVLAIIGIVLAVTR